MSENVLVLRTCAANGGAYGGFIWPESGEVVAPDWDPSPECGNGLHGLLWGEGDGSILNWDSDARWLVCEVDAADVVDIGGKVKFPRANVVYCGDRDGATALLSLARPGAVVCGGTATAGYRGTATAGEGGTATAGDDGTATAGYRGTATAGYRGTATAGDCGELRFRWFDYRCRTTVGYVGEGGIRPNVPYRCDDSGNIVPEDRPEQLAKFGGES